MGSAGDSRRNEWIDGVSFTIWEITSKIWRKHLVNKGITSSVVLMTVRASSSGPPQSFKTTCPDRGQARGYGLPPDLIRPEVQPVRRAMAAQGRGRDER